MTKELCKDCGKPSISNSPGSVTSYFFQYNYCQCKKAEQLNKPSQNKLIQSGRNSPVCANCGKSRPTNRRAGSFTSFLFKELRCNCAGAATPKSAASAVSTVGSSSTSSVVRTSTGERVAQRKQFTESVRNRRLTASNSRSQKSLSVGDIVGNTFRIISLVGIGGMGVVYLAEHTALHRQFALKVLATELVNEQNWLRFQVEAKTLASLNHPTFVKVYDLGIDARTTPFYSMDYLQGYSLEERLMLNGPLCLEEAISVFLEVLDGLAYAHRNGIVHRDIKPGNIMICTVDGVKTVKVLDFGISKLVGADALKSQSLTAVGELFGSPFYMSPEQCMGNAVDARSDVYSIGCTLFEVLTGFVPFEARAALEIMTMHQEQEPPLLSDVLPDSQFPPSVDLVLKKCLAKLPKDRYQSAKELAIDLQRIQEGKDVRAYSTAFPEKIQVKEHHANQVARSQKKNRLIGEGSSFHRNILILGLIGVFAIAALGSSYWFIARRTTDSRNPYVSSHKTPSLADTHPSTQFDAISRNSLDEINDIRRDAHHYCDLGEYAKAEPLTRRELALIEKLHGPNHLDVADSLHNLGIELREQGKYAESIVFTEREAAIKEKNLGPNHLEVVQCLNGLCYLYRVRGASAQAESLLKRMLAAREKGFGPNHPNVAAQLNDLGVFYYKQGKYAKAEPLLKRSLAIYEQAFGPSHPYVATSLGHYLDLLRKTNRKAEAAVLRARANTMIKHK